MSRELKWVKLFEDYGPKTEIGDEIKLQLDRLRDALIRELENEKNYESTRYVKNFLANISSYMLKQHEEEKVLEDQPRHFAQNQRIREGLDNIIGKL
jgi:hypothetical protein